MQLLSSNPALRVVPSTAVLQPSVLRARMSSYRRDGQTGPCSTLAGRRHSKSPLQRGRTLGVPPGQPTTQHDDAQAARTSAATGGGKGEKGTFFLSLARSRPIVPPATRCTQRSGRLLLLRKSN